MCTGVRTASERLRVNRFIPVWRLVIPVFWIGMVGAISVIEAPLKFQAPGITVPLGLGIGRLVFTALNSVEGVLAVALLAACLLPRGAAIAGRSRWLMWTAIAAYVVKVAAVRPPLNARTSAVLAGADPGQSVWHYAYIVLDTVMLIALLLLAIRQGRALAAAATLGDTATPGDAAPTGHGRTGGPGAQAHPQPAGEVSAPDRPPHRPARPASDPGGAAPR